MLVILFHEEKSNLIQHLVIIYEKYFTQFLYKNYLT